MFTQLRGPKIWSVKMNEKYTETPSLNGDNALLPGGEVLIKSFKRQTLPASHRPTRRFKSISKDENVFLGERVCLNGF